MTRGSGRRASWTRPRGAPPFPLPLPPLSFGSELLLVEGRGAWESKGKGDDGKTDLGRLGLHLLDPLLHRLELLRTRSGEVGGRSKGQGQGQARACGRPREADVRLQPRPGRRGGAGCRRTLPRRPSCASCRCAVVRLWVVELDGGEGGRFPPLAKVPMQFDGPSRPPARPLFAPPSARRRLAPPTDRPPLPPLPAPSSLTPSHRSCPVPPKPSSCVLSFPPSLILGSQAGEAEGARGGGPRERTFPSVRPPVVVGPVRCSAVGRSVGALGQGVEPSWEGNEGGGEGYDCRNTSFKTLTPRIREASQADISLAPPPSPSGLDPDRLVLRAWPRCVVARQL